MRRTPHSKPLHSLARLLSVGLLMHAVAAPAEVRTLAAHDTPGYAQSLTVFGKRVFVADGDRGLRIFDATESASIPHTLRKYA